MSLLVSTEARLHEQALRHKASDRQKERQVVTISHQRTRHIILAPEPVLCMEDNYAYIESLNPPKNHPTAKRAVPWSVWEMAQNIQTPHRGFLFSCGRNVKNMFQAVWWPICWLPRHPNPMNHD